MGRPVPENEYREKAFTAPLTVTKQASGLWKVARTFRYYVKEIGGSDFVEVPAGFSTDFASVPRGLWNLFPPDGPWTQAAVLHDALYSMQGDIPKGRARSRKECDDIFRESMQVLGVPLWKRYTIYYAVRSFGWIPWGSR